jgi:hypothetical protein
MRIRSRAGSNNSICLPGACCPGALVSSSPTSRNSIVITLRCPGCQRVLRRDDSRLGMVDQCQACGRRFRIPAKKAAIPRSEQARPATNEKLAASSRGTQKLLEDGDEGLPYADEFEEVVTAERRSQKSPSNASCQRNSSDNLGPTAPSNHGDDTPYSVTPDETAGALPREEVASNMQQSIAARKKSKSEFQRLLRRGSTFFEFMGWFDDIDIFMNIGIATTIAGLFAGAMAQGFLPAAFLTMLLALFLAAAAYFWPNDELRDSESWLIFINSGQTFFIGPILVVCSFVRLAFTVSLDTLLMLLLVALVGIAVLSAEKLLIEELRAYWNVVKRVLLLALAGLLMLLAINGAVRSMGGFMQLGIAMDGGRYVRNPPTFIPTTPSVCRIVKAFSTEYHNIKYNATERRWLLHP